jgi:cytochrome c oxidase assembly protein subunit 11
MKEAIGDDKNMHQRTNLTMAIVAVILSMILLAFAAVPIYDLFCKATGFGGATKRAFSSYQIMGKKKIMVRFDSNTSPALNWKFIPKQAAVEVITGENVLVFYYAENLSDKDIIGTAVFNVTPLKAGQYFNKIHCFCFEEQLLKAHSSALMPVSFYIDPEIEHDSDTSDLDTITLSYSFFKVKDVN